MKSIFTLFLIICFLSFEGEAFSQTPSYVPTDSLIGWWPFSGNADDLSVNANHGTVLNGTILSEDRFANSNSSYLVDGINCPDAKGISLPSSIDNTQNYSISIWFQTTDSTKSDQSLFNSLPHQYIAVNFNYPYGGFDNKTCAFLGNGGWQIMGSTANWNTYNMLDWHHLVVVKDSSELNFYQDGLLAYTQVINPTFNSGSFSSIVVGAISVNGGSQCYETFNGRIDDVGIWNRSLSICEILNLYNSSSTSLTITVSNDTLYSDQANASSYQWLDCNDNYSTISSETNQFFYPSLSGNYAVEIDMSGCIDTSNCYSFTPGNIGLNKITPNTEIKIFPNPSNGEISIEVTTDMFGSEYTIINQLGEKVLFGIINENKTILNLNNLNLGIYFISIFNDTKSYQSKLVKN
ncbi:MAG: T9SS type A sorting domain-containing protein [Crocinitomicaceae bacterium]|nr:T9SS type A sorting domain-containing protein [Crocinitomicaceae bacterium]